MEIKIQIPEEFCEMCEFMDVSIPHFLERFVVNVLSYEDVEDPDGAEITMAIRYFLIYSANRNRIYGKQVLVREAFIKKTVKEVNPFLLDLIDNGGLVMETEVLEFLQDWKFKWKKVNQAWNEESVKKDRDESQPQQSKEHLFIANYNVSHFESIGIDTFADVVIQKGNTESIRIESKENMGHIVVTKIEDKRLWITVKNDSFDVIPYAVIYVTYKTLSGLVVNHSGNVTAKEPIEGGFLGVIQNGKGHIDLHVDVSTLDATITKTGSLKISGPADKAHILNTGPGTFDGIDLETSEAKVTIKDSGGVSLHVEDELHAALEGDGNLMLKGEPRLKTFTMS